MVDISWQAKRIYIYMEQMRHEKDAGDVIFVLELEEAQRWNS